MRKLFIALLSFALLSATVTAQDFPDLGSVRQLKDKVSEKTQLELPESPQIEHPVDEYEYIVGPGDVFDIIIAEQPEEEQQIMVSPEGDLVMPSTGPIKVAGLTLYEAKEKIRTQLSNKYLSDGLYISLTQLRTFRVTVSGAVNIPGLIIVNGMDRVSDAIYYAGGLVEPSFFKDEEKQRQQLRDTPRAQQQKEIIVDEYADVKRKKASRRNIIVKRRNGKILHADIYKYERCGDLEANPYLVDGDVIVVPSRQEKIGQLIISGAVRTPDTMEYAQGDRIRDLVEMAHGFTLDADSSHMELVRFKDNKHPHKMTYEIDWSDSAQVETVMNTSLQPDDRLFVRRIPDYHIKRTVEVKGEVTYPGEYALIHNPTRLSDVIDMAGSFTNEAALCNAHVIRRSIRKEKNPELEWLDMMMVSDMRKEERAYYQTKLQQQQNRVYTDFVALFEDGDEDFDIPLKNDDLIVVPAKTYAVNIIGQVKYPGVQEWMPGKGLKYYIKKAGGYNEGAWKKKISINKIASGVFVEPDKTSIEMGDTIFVPQKPERDVYELVRDIVLITSQAASVIMLMVQTNYWMNRD